jgi:hypothetical protein
MPLTRGSRGNTQSALAPEEFQNVHEAKKSTWNQMMELFLTPSSPNPCESRLSNDENPDAPVVTREQPEEGDLLDYVFENVESNVCRGDAETEIETKGNKRLGVSIPSLRRNNSLIDRDDAEEDMSMDGNSRKPRDGHELERNNSIIDREDDMVFSWRTGKIVNRSKQDASDRPPQARVAVDDTGRQKGNPDLLDYVFQNTEYFVCGESITPDEIIMDPNEDEAIIGACSFRDQDPEPPTTKTREPVKNTEKGNPDALDYVFENTESFVCGESMDPDEDDGIIGACSFRDQDPEPPTYAKVPEPPTHTKEVVERPNVEDAHKDGPDALDYVFENTESFVCGEPTHQTSRYETRCPCLF